MVWAVCGSGVVVVVGQEGVGRKGVLGGPNWHDEILEENHNEVATLCVAISSMLSACHDFVLCNFEHNSRPFEEREPMPPFQQGSEIVPPSQVEAVPDWRCWRNWRIQDELLLGVEVEALSVQELAPPPFCDVLALLGVLEVPLKLFSLRIQMFLEDLWWRKIKAMILQVMADFEHCIEGEDLDALSRVALPLPPGMHPLAIEHMVRSCEEPGCEEPEDLSKVA